MWGLMAFIVLLFGMGMFSLTVVERTESRITRCMAMFTAGTCLTTLSALIALGVYRCCSQ